ncbi:MAG TPA: ATP-binding protein [Ktedonobacterales bacterium]|nr:ATP-binding protein [Ktedonobacterales bacterium]
MHSPWTGYVAAVAGVALISFVIGLILAGHVQIANISMLYLVPVLALAVFFGRGPAVLASLLAFVAFDYFFVPPLHVLAVDDAYAWLSLALLLVTALVTGQLTATLRLQAHEARQRQRQTATLYELAQLIAAGTDLDTVLRATAERVVQVFASAGARASLIAMPDHDGQLRERAAATAAEGVQPYAPTKAAIEIRARPERTPVAQRRHDAIGGTLRLDIAECAALARRVLDEGIPIMRQLAANDANDASDDDLIEVLFAPLRSGGQTVGILGVAGEPGMGAHLAEGMRPYAPMDAMTRPRATPRDAHSAAAPRRDDGAQKVYIRKPLRYDAAGAHPHSATSSVQHDGPGSKRAMATPDGIYAYVPATPANMGSGQRQADARWTGSQPLVALFDAFRGQIALAIERANLEAAAVHAEALRESDRLKDALLGSVTHDLRTPLAAIKAVTTSLLQPAFSVTDRERHELIESMDTSVDRLNRLVSNLLDLSRLEAGVAAPQRDWHLIGDVLATVLQRLELAGQSGASSGRRIDIDLPPDLPLLEIDHEQIEQVLTNLIENALKYSPPDTPVGVAAQLMPGTAELEVRVSDMGIGIPARDLDAVFDKFYRVQRQGVPWASTRAPAGTGLGLAICRAIVRAHGGRIWAESQGDRGTTVAFTLPLASDAPAGELPELPELAYPRGDLSPGPSPRRGGEAEAEGVRPYAPTDCARGGEADGSFVRGEGPGGRSRHDR